MTTHRPRALRRIADTTATSDGDDWRQRAACRGVDPEAFFAPGKPGRGKAREVDHRAASACARCPVAAECLQYAYDFAIPYGVFGGLLPEERDETLRGVR